MKSYPIPLDIRNALAAEPFMAKCIYLYRNDATQCQGRIEFEHAWTFAGRRLNRPWAVVPACSTHHRGGKADKEYHRLISLLRATDTELATHSKSENLRHRRDYLKMRYADKLLPNVLTAIPLAPLQKL